MTKHHSEVIVENSKIHKIEPVNPLPIRSYLDQTVIPVLLEGMAEIAKVKPNNPVEYLANFLLRHSNENNNK